jgi:hypothetical protein
MLHRGCGFDVTRASWRTLFGHRGVSGLLLYRHKTRQLTRITIKQIARSLWKSPPLHNIGLVSVHHFITMVVKKTSPDPVSLRTTVTATLDKSQMTSFFNQPGENNVHTDVVVVADNAPLTPGTSAEEAAPDAGNTFHESTISYVETWWPLNRDVSANDHLQPLRLRSRRNRLRSWAYRLLRTEASSTYTKVVNH